VNKLSSRSVALTLLAALLTLPVGTALAQSPSSSSGSGSGSGVTGNDPQPIGNATIALILLQIWG
jgi:hypothetical protein